MGAITHGLQSDHASLRAFKPSSQLYRSFKIVNRVLKHASFIKVWSIVGSESGQGGAADLEIAEESAQRDCGGVFLPLVS